MRPPYPGFPKREKQSSFWLWACIIFLLIYFLTWWHAMGEDDVTCTTEGHAYSVFLFKSYRNEDKDYLCQKKVTP